MTPQQLDLLQDIVSFNNGDILINANEDFGPLSVSALRYVLDAAEAETLQVASERSYISPEESIFGKDSDYLSAEQEAAYEEEFESATVRWRQRHGRIAQRMNNDIVVGRIEAADIAFEADLARLTIEGEALMEQERLHIAASQSWGMWMAWYPDRERLNMERSVMIACERNRLQALEGIPHVWDGGEELRHSDAQRMTEEDLHAYWAVLRERTEIARYERLRDSVHTWDGGAELRLSDLMRLSPEGMVEYEQAMLERADYAALPEEVRAEMEAEAERLEMEAEAARLEAEAEAIRLEEERQMARLTPEAEEARQEVFLALDEAWENRTPEGQDSLTHSNLDYLEAQAERDAEWDEFWARLSERFGRELSFASTYLDDEEAQSLMENSQSDWKIWRNYVAIIQNQEELLPIDVNHGGSTIPADAEYWNEQRMLAEEAERLARLEFLSDNLDQEDYELHWLVVQSESDLEVFNEWLMKLYRGYNRREDFARHFPEKDFAGHRWIGSWMWPQYQRRNMNGIYVELPMSVWARMAPREYRHYQIYWNEVLRASLISDLGDLGDDWP